MKTRLILRGLSCWGHANLRTWEPDDPHNIAESIWADIGHRSHAGSDIFSIKVGTPAGLAGMEGRKGIIAMRPLLVVDKYDFANLWDWFESILLRCDSEDWRSGVEQLRRYFDWEYDNYIEH